MDDKKKDRLVALINGAELIKNLELIYISLISSDSNFCIEDCKVNIENLEGLLEALPETDLNETDKKKWEEKFKDGIRILKRDIKDFERINKINVNERLKNNNNTSSLN